MIKLRQAQFADYTAIAKLHADNWRQNYRGILSDEYLDKEVEQDRLDTWYGRLKSPAENQLVTMATLDETIAGFCCVYLNDDPVFGSYIDNLHVATHLQKSGIGRVLIKDCAAKICEHSNSEQMYLWVFESNKNARFFYERVGGTNFETLEKKNEDGTVSQTCRYTWNDVSKLL
ncbi:MAG: GNAT family N-acetyltransferase [Chitinophagaceae bacterium]